jgi:hypothetical protein
VTRGKVDTDRLIRLLKNDDDPRNGTKQHEPTRKRLGFCWCYFVFLSCDFVDRTASLIDSKFPGAG